MKLLVVASEPISAGQLRDAIGDDVRPDNVQVLVVAPALHASALKFWLSDADEAIARSEQVQRETVSELGEAGIPSSGDTGESDPTKAVEDALSTFPADRIVLFTHPDQEQHYREDLDERELEQRLGIPVVRAQVSSSAG